MTLRRTASGFCGEGADKSETLDFMHAHRRRQALRLLQTEEARTQKLRSPGCWREKRMAILLACAPETPSIIPMVHKPNLTTSYGFFPTVQDSTKILTSVP